MEINVKNKVSYKGEGVYIGRPSILQNPIRITELVSRELSIYRYSLYIKREISHNSPKILSELERLLSILLDKLELNLICWCNPKLCHGSIIKQILLNKVYHESWLVNGMIGMKVNGEEV